MPLSIKYVALQSWYSESSQLFPGIPFAVALAQQEELFVAILRILLENFPTGVSTKLPSLENLQLQGGADYFAKRLQEQLVYWNVRVLTDVALRYQTGF